MDDLQYFKDAAASNEWSLIWPEISVGLLALSLLVVEMLVPKMKNRLVPMIAMIGLSVITVTLVLSWVGMGVSYGESFAGLLFQSGFGESMRLFFLLGGLFICFLGYVTLQGRAIPRVEFFHIVLVVTAALMLLAQSNHFVMIFITLETVTIGFYILVSYFRNQPISLEAGLKYLILGGLSTGLLLFGIALLYGAAGNPQLAGATAEGLNLQALRAFLLNHGDHTLAVAGMLLVLFGIAFKVAVFPFQIWVPDVYQGAPTAVTAFLGVCSKAAGFALMIILVTRTFNVETMTSITVPLLSLMAIFSLLYGNLTALTQQNTKRLMGLSGISHAGFLLAGVVAAVHVDWAVWAVVFYLFSYMFSSFAVFGVMAFVEGKNPGEGEELIDYTGLYQRSPFLGTVLGIGLGSLAGIPPLVGFIGKALVFIALFQAGLYVLLLVGALSVAISIFYYFGWMRTAFFGDGPDTEKDYPAIEVPLPKRVPLAIIAGITVFLGFIQVPLAAVLGL
ncbi:MAG: NADH-quinone oxidoreductase subunit N [Opitutales bacterium]|nr:NADH-quinone oxidoreductase subunit N [Opitutales bacterium]MCH8540740.1 NADH-quinone oxidoreductase subunit N [Opitutales bacterium]